MFIILLLAAFIGISLLLRIYLPYGQVVVGDTIKFQSTDSPFYMRQLDNLLAHFPQTTTFDPYYLYPGGINYAPLPLFEWIIAFFAWIAGAGHPTQHTLDMVAILIPAIMGALIVIPVFFIGKTLFNKWVGIFAAGLVAVFPGEFLSRTMLSCSDFPVVEVFFTTTALAFLIAAIKTAKQNQFTFSHLWKRDWKIVRKPLIYALLAGVFLGFYLATWFGALIFVAIISLYYVIQFIVNHLNNKSSDYLCFTGVISFFVAFLIYLPFVITNAITFTIVVAIFIPPVLYGVSRFVSSRGLKAYYYPIALVIIGVLVFVVTRFAAPAVFDTLLDKFNFVFFPGGPTGETTQEISTMLIPEGYYTLTTAWGNFSTSFFIAPWWLIFGIGAAAICGYILYLNNQNRNGTSLFIFLILATVIMIIFTVIQVPHEYMMSDDQIWFIPGIAFISLSLLLYSFVRRGREQPWYFILLWIVAILIVLSMLIKFTTYSNIRYLVILPMGILIYVLFKQSEGDENLRLFIIWSLVILIIALIQRRFQYYLAVNMALLSGYLAWQIIWQSGLKKLTQKPEEPKEIVHISKTKMKRKAIAEKRGMRTYYLNAFLALVIVVLFIFSPNISMAQRQAKTPSFVIPDHMVAAMLWLKDNTPEPMGDANAYYQVYDAVSPGEKFKYPESFYAVTAWWDHGYYITRIAHRVPNANPNQNADAIRRVATFLLSQNQSAANEIRKELGSGYVVVDYQTANFDISQRFSSFYRAIAKWANQETEKYSEIYLIQYGNNQLVPKIFYYPEYYRSTCVHLYNFNGKAVTSENATVLTYQIIKDDEGNSYKLITETKEFASYQQAMDYATAQGLDTHAVVGVSPFISCIKLDALSDYKLVYESPVLKTHQDFTLLPSLSVKTDTVPIVKIFEYIGND